MGDHSNQDIWGGTIGDVENLEQGWSYDNEQEYSQHDGTHLCFIFFFLGKCWWLLPGGNLSPQDYPSDAFRFSTSFADRWPESVIAYHLLTSIDTIIKRKRVKWMICNIYVRLMSNQKHFLWTMDDPVSLNSCLEIHIVWKVEREDKIEPPIHTKNFLSEGAKTLIFIVDGAKAVTSLLNLSGIPGNIVVPPLITMLEYKSFLTSTSHFMMDW